MNSKCACIEFVNPIGGSKTAGYGERYTKSGVNNAYGAGSGNGFGNVEFDANNGFYKGNPWTGILDIGSKAS